MNDTLMANNLNSLYRYALIAASEHQSFKLSDDYKNNELFEHVRRLFSKTQEYHEKVYEEIQNQPKKNFLNVGIIEAKDLASKSSTALIDPYCYIYLTANNDVKRLNHRKTNSYDMNASNKCKLSKSPMSSPAISPNSSPKLLRKASTRGSSFRSIHSSTEIISSNKTSCRKETLTPCWNERFQYEICDRNKQTLIIQCFRYDSESASLLSNFTEKSSNKRLFKSFKTFLENRKIADDFIGQVQIPVKDIDQSVTKWFDLRCKHNNGEHGIRGKIKLNLELIIKLGDLGQNTPDLITSASLFNNELSKETFIVEYHKLLQIIMENELTKRKKEKTEWDGSIDYLSQTLLRLFRDTFFISDLSKQIIELITKMEFKKYYKQLLPDQKIISDLTKLANDISDTPTIILLLSEYEKRKLYEDSCVYIKEYLSNKTFDLFPPNNENEQIISESIKLSNQIDKLLSTITGDENLNFKKVPADILSKRLQEDVNKFISKRINLDEAAEKNDSQLLKWMHNINDTLEDILSYKETMSYFNNNLLNLLEIEYCKLIAITLSNSLTGAVQFVLRCLSDYQMEYRLYTTNMKFSSHVSTHLFINCRELCNLFSKYLQDREKFKFQLLNYTNWFKEQQIVSFWLETFKIVAREFVTNALKMEDVKEISNGDDPGITMTSVLVAQHLIKICKEWNEIDFNDTETKYVGTVALTEIIIDSCRFFVQSLKQCLDEQNYYFGTELSSSQSQIDPVYKICILMNNIDHLKVQTISSLPSLLKFDSVQNEIEVAYDSVVSKNIRDVLEKSVSEALKDMDILTVGILEKMTNILIPTIKARVLSLYYNKNSNIIDHIHRNLHLINTKMPAYSKYLVIFMWNNLIKIMNKFLPVKETSSFYENIEKCLKLLEELFISYDLPYEYTIRATKNYEILKIIENELNQEDYCENGSIPISDVSIDVNEISDLDRLAAKIQLFSRRTEDIILEHLKYLSDTKPVSHDSDYFGSVLFKIGYEEETQTTVRVNLKILFCKNLPILDLLSKSSDPYVTIELLPKSMFSEAQVERTNIVYTSLNPVFNETFTFNAIPKEFMKKQGTCLRISVWDYDVIGGDDFAGEIFYPLIYIDSMEKFSSIDMMPVIMSPLRQPTGSERKILKEIERRSTFDDQAHDFAKNRVYLMEKCELQRKAKISGQQQNCFEAAKSTWNKFRSKFPCIPSSFSK